MKTRLSHSQGFASMWAAAFATALSAAPASAIELTVYSATDPDNLKVISDAFQEKNPDISINWVRDSTGIIAARLLAEQKNPRADVIFGLAATAVLGFDKLGMFQPYTANGVDKLDPRFQDLKEEPDHWVGIYGWTGAICFNTIEAEKHNLPKPAKWSDLTDPVYEGHITMPNPASSGTGYLDISSWIQIWGEDQAWDYMDKLHPNIATYTHSGSKPCKQAASGETVVGISWPFRGAKLKSKGAPIDIIIPEEGIGWDMQTVAIVKGTEKLEAAQKFVDWTISKPAMEIYADRYSVVGIPGMTKKWENFPMEEVQARMVDNDFVWAANNKSRLVSEWRGRYDGKSEPKK